MSEDALSLAEGNAGRTTWDGNDQAGRGVASGVYLYRFKAADYTESRKMVRLR